jgi:hypothetical protein
MAALAYTDIQKNVRTILDYNKVSAALDSMDEFSALDIDSMIKDSVSPALMQLMMMAPLEIVEQSVTSKTLALAASGLSPVEMQLPDDFLRFVSCKLTSWKYPVTELSAMGSKEHQRQYGEVEGLKATASNPIAVMDYSETSGKKTLILFNGVKGDTEATCNYVGIPESTTTGITLSERLHVPLYYIVASLVCEILKDTQKSQYMMQTARSLMTSAEGVMQQTIQANT